MQLQESEKPLTATVHILEQPVTQVPIQEFDTVANRSGVSQPWETAFKRAHVDFQRRHRLQMRCCNVLLDPQELVKRDLTRTHLFAVHAPETSLGDVPADVQVDRGVAKKRFLDRPEQAVNRSSGEVSTRFALAKLVKNPLQVRTQKERLV